MSPRALRSAYRDQGETMGQHGTPQDDRRDRGALDAPTTPLRPRRVGPLGSLHDGQRRWHPVVRFLWWAFLLPVAIFAWSSACLRGGFRAGGYVLAGFVLLFGVAVMSAPATPPTTSTAKPTGQVAAAQVAPAQVAAAPVAPAQTAPAQVAPAQVAPVQTASAQDAAVLAPAARPAALAPPTTHRPAAPVHTPRPVTRAPSHPRPAPVRAPAASRATAGDTYTNVDGNQVQRPIASAAQPSGATAKCKDGSWSFSQHRSGTCSGHGGVARWL